MLIPDEREFERLAAAGYNLIPICREIAADLETPVSAFLKVAANRDYAFLLESVSGGEKWARYSFLGAEPSMVIRGRDDRIELTTPAGGTEVRTGIDPFAELRRELGRFRAPDLPHLPRFFGGAVGYIAYDTVRRFERLPKPPRDDLGTPDLCLMLTDCVLIFDNVRQTIKVVANVSLDGHASPAAAWRDGAARIDRTVARLAESATLPRLEKPTVVSGGSLKSNFSREEYVAMVERARDHIVAGDVVQVVPSNRFETPLAAHPFNLYRSLRAINPSPYLFYLQLGDHALAGASPEVMVRVEGREVTVRPMAGTRQRGTTDAEDRGHERDLLDDPRERAEHVMLVDLGRNDIGRVARLGTVEVTELMTVERYSHAMHLVSNVRGILRDGADAFDAFRAAFPPGTVSGAPKVRAMEIIDDLEPVRRGPYGGAVGYFSYTGNTDTAIVQRTMLIKDGVIYMQAGGGVGADSNPEAEYDESVGKAGAMMDAVEGARGFERSAAGEE